MLTNVTEQIERIVFVPISFRIRLRKFAKRFSRTRVTLYTKWLAGSFFILACRMRQKPTTFSIPKCFQEKIKRGSDKCGLERRLPLGESQPKTNRSSAPHQLEMMQRKRHHGYYGHDQTAAMERQPKHASLVHFVHFLSLVCAFIAILLQHNGVGLINTSKTWRSHWLTPCSSPLKKAKR